MNKEDAVLVIFLVLLLAVAGCSGSKPVEPDEAGEKPNSKAFETVYSGSVGEGDVTVDLTPVGVVDGKLMVDVGVNTHSVNLEQFDLIRITTLEYNGKSIAPESAPALSGHHNSGTLAFNVGEPVSSFKISIKGIPKVDERVFEWGYRRGTKVP